MIETSTLDCSKSTHQCPVFLFDFKNSKNHENADTLNIIKIFDTEFTYCLKIESWQDYSGKVVWIPPDSLVDITRTEFAFLAEGAKLKDAQGVNNKEGKYVVVRAKNIRGVISYGLLVPYNGILEIGQNAADELGVIHYEPEEEPAKLVDGETESAPAGVYYKYDIDSAQKWAAKVFTEGELVVVTRKYNGECWKGLYKDGVFHVSSHRFWKKEFASAPAINVEDLKTRLMGKLSESEALAKAEEIYKLKVTNYKPSRNKWWNGLYDTPGLVDWLKANEGVCIYGELINTKGGYAYGLKPGEVRVKIFDALKPDGTWMPFPDLLYSCDKIGLQMVDIIHYDFPYNFEKLRDLAENLEYTDCTKPNEGIVFIGANETWNYGIGRNKFKIVSSKYSQKN